MALVFVAICDLQPMQACIGAAFGEQRVMSAFFDYAASFHHDDLVRIADGRQAVGDNDGGTTFGKPVEGLSHQFF